jgi:hypothetical protein
MSFIQVSDAFITKGRALDTYFKRDWQVSDNFENVKRGGDYFIVTMPSTFTSIRVDAHHRQFVWIVLFDLYIRYKTIAGSLRKFAEIRDDILEHYHSDPLLLNTPGVSDVIVSAAGEVLQNLPGGNPTFYAQTLSAAITQRKKLVF